MIPIANETKSTCPYCGVGCGVLIETQGREITGVRGNTKGWADASSLYTVATTGGTLLH